MRSVLTVPVLGSILVSVVLTQDARAQDIPTPDQYFGFALGTDGELAPYPQVLEYLQLIAARSDRVEYEELDKSTMGNPYSLLRISSPENIARLDRLMEINTLLADPRLLEPGEAEPLFEEGRPFYFLYATIHSSEVGNGQTILEIAHELATSDTRETQEILDNAVLLMVPSQNPDGQVLLIDHYYKNRGTDKSSSYPDLYHKYTGHDDNRDWFMFTQKETRLNIERVQNVYRPQVTHDMHQMGSNGFRMFVPPFKDPYDRNFHPILHKGQAQIGHAMSAALVAEGKAGVGWLNQYDLWTPARQYMVYHGQPRILTEIASVNFASPQIDPNGRPLGPQESLSNFPMPYTGSDWRLRDIMDYGKTAVFAGLTHVAKYRRTWMRNFYKVHSDWVNRTDAPYAFVVSSEQRDPYETYEMLQLLDFADVEIHRAEAPFAAGGRQFGAGSYVIRTAQPYGAFAKTMMEIQEYPDLRAFPGGPPIPPYDVTAHTLGYLLGVDVEQVEEPFEAQLELIYRIEPMSAPALAAPGDGVYLFGPESNAGFLAAHRLQAAGIGVRRTLELHGMEFPPHRAGTWIVQASPTAQEILSRTSQETGLVVRSAPAMPSVPTKDLGTVNRVGLWRGINNMPGGWMMWLFEKYEVNHRIVSAERKTSNGAPWSI